MIRKQVENLQGLVLTPEELDFIQPIVETSKKMNYNQVTCIDRKIAELEARRDALIHGYCTGYYGMNYKPYIDPYELDEEELP